MINLQNKKLFAFISLFFLFAFLAISPVFAEESAEASDPSWFKYLEIIGTILAFITIVQGMILVSRTAGGSLSKSFLWYPIGAMFVAVALVLRMVTEFAGLELFGLELAFELCVYLGVTFWVIGTQKSINSLK